MQMLSMKATENADVKCEQGLILTKKPVNILTLVCSSVTSKFASRQPIFRLVDWIDKLTICKKISETFSHISLILKFSSVVNIYL